MRPFSRTRIAALFTGERRGAERPRLMRCLGLALLGLALAVPQAVAQQDGERDRDRPDRDQPVEEWQDRDRDRPGGGAAELRVFPDPRPPVGRRVTLGVYASPAEVGYRVDGVQGGTPASRVGLEPGDVIVAVDGYQVGRVGLGFYPLGRELQRRGGVDLEVVLLVQDIRSRRLLNLDVSFGWRQPFGPVFRDREFAEGGPGRAAEAAPEEGAGEGEFRGERRGELQ